MPRNSQRILRVRKLHSITLDATSSCTASSWQIAQRRPTRSLTEKLSFSTAQAWDGIVSFQDHGFVVYSVLNIDVLM